MNQLARFDTSSLNQLNRALIGFDRIFSDFENRFQHSTTNYPPYNVIKHDDNSFEIEVAVAGFERSDITIEVDQDQLRIKGKRLKEDDPSMYVYRGLAARDFERTFTLAEHIIVGEAELTNGILHVKLTREVPEALKPRLIEIK
ncbi:MAG: heat-shock protein [Proteobacteria bacterium]|nr:heat-shock protein [Pseudomonadota bacterium]NBP14091.1 heat-shock protein [bacterium]